jgi:hypothetical protein
VSALRYVQIQTQSRCNADCVFCPYSRSWHAEHPGRMSDALWRKLLEDLRPFEAGLSRGLVAPYLMQEPLLDPTIFEKIADITAAFPRTMVQLATNGAALTERNIERLIAALAGRKHQLWVSHHGLTAGQVSQVMRMDGARAEANILRLLERAGGALRVTVRGAGVSLDGGPPLFDPGDYRARWRRLLDERGIDARRVHIDALQYHSRAGTVAGPGAGAPVRAIGPDAPFHCWRIDEWLHVAWDGSLRLCCMDYHGEVALPNLGEISVSQWLGSPEYAALRAQVTGATRPAAGFLCNRCTSPGG